MATKKNMAIIIATIKSIYPYYAKDTNIEILAKTWLLLLQDYDDKIINNALILCMKECETPPTPAHIIKKIENMQPKAQPTELWSVLVDTLQKAYEQQERFAYTFKHEDGLTTGEKARQKTRELYERLPNEIKVYIGSYGEMLRMARQMDEKFLTFEKSKFLKSIVEIREQSKTMLLASVSAPMIESAEKENKNILK